MIEFIKKIFIDTFLYEKILCKFDSVFNKNKEKKYSVKLTKNDIELLTLCHKYGITINELKEFEYSTVKEKI